MTNRILIVLVSLCLVVTGCLVAGCDPSKAAADPLSRVTDNGFKIVAPVLEKGLTELSTRTGQMQGTLTGVEPGYTVEGYGIFGTGLVYKGTLYMKGVSGTLQGATQADEGQASPDARAPGNRAPATQPTK